MVEKIKESGYSIMPEMSVLIENLKGGSYGFDNLKNFFVRVYENAFEGLVGQFSEFFPYALLALSVILLFIGARTFPVLRFVGVAVLGYGLGCYLLAPVVTGVVKFIPGIVVGVVVAIVAVLLRKPLYYAGLAAFLAYFGYAFTYAGKLFGLFAGDQMMSLAVGVAAALLVVILHKFALMVGTAALGAIGVVNFVLGMFDFTTIFGNDNRTLVAYAALGLVGVIGTVLQIVTRKRY